MKKVICTVIAVLSFVLCQDAYSQEQVFLSLTRRADSFKNLPSNVSVITRDQIIESEAQNLGEVLDKEIGLNRSINGTLGSESTVMFRGSRSEQTLVMIDGVNINSVSLGITDMSTIPIDNIERIEIVRGGSSSIFGSNAFGGTINIITRKPSEIGQKLNFDASVGSFASRSAGINFSVKNEKKYGIAIVSKNNCDGFRQNSSYEAYDFFGKFGYSLKNSDQIDVSASIFNSDQGVPGILFDPLTFAFIGPDKYNGTIEKSASTPNGSQKFLRNLFKIDFTKEINDNSLKISGYGLREKMNTQNTLILGVNKNEFISIVSGLEAQILMKNDLTVGAEIREEASTNEDLLTSNYVIDKSRTNSSLYAIKKLNFSKFMFIPSMRVDSNSAFGSIFVPKISIVYEASSKINISANSGKSWRVPTFNELYYKDAFGSSGNPNLKPEEGITSDAGIHYFNAGISGSATLFQTASKNLIEWVTNPLTFASTPQNISVARQSGAEMNFDQKITKSLSQSFNFTYLWAEDENAHKVLIYRPQNKLNYLVSYLLPWNSKINLNLEYVSPRKTGNTLIPELSDYTLIGAGIMKNISENQIWLKADNITNVNYQTRLGYPLPGVTFSAGVRINFK